MKNILLLSFLIISTFCRCQNVFLSSNIIDNDYDRSVIFVSNRFEADCIIKVVKSNSESKKCGYWHLTDNKLNAEYKFLLTTPYSNRWINGKRPLKVYKSKSWFLLSEERCDCEKLYK